ncbi:hypothetical protein BO221_19955 [Archangium sp. Cb G35]|uniref:RHS repeat-associated core domain-containing protein n=1 Tax=Archangium sp. Cb G35 TaxID=1920190 RepID=UPI000935CE54|nr:RHS repeat-associated core domain-containing protein [Archangium sp. Cb G35]OJT23149.1 hypothetical protein BO221_19955 [Archangium sp. Cb G35]
MMPAAKHLDPLLGIDIHLIITPPGAVVPIPHPFVGIVFDPMDYVPILGTTVFVGGLPRAQAGTGGIALPPHFPIGGVFAKPPANEAEIFMGSSTVLVEDEPFSHLALPVLSCQDIGVPPFPRRRKKKSMASLVLPTTLVLSIPVPVVIGGPPTVSLMALGMRAGMAVLGALVSKVRKARGSRKAQNGVHCNGGHPVDVITGANFDDFLDARSPPPGLFCWRRYYSTARADLYGPLGWGFRHEYQHTLHLSSQVWRYEDPTGRIVDFEPLDAETHEASLHGVVLRRTSSRQFTLREGNGPVLHLEAAPGSHVATLRAVQSGPQRLELSWDEERLVQLEEVSPAGRVRYRLKYDAAGLLLELLRMGGREPQCLARYTYDRQGHLVTSCDAEGGSYQYEYDGAHRWTRMRDPNGYSFWWKYDQEGRCIETAGQDGLWWTRLEYDRERWETRVTERSGGVHIFRYNEDHTLLELVDPYGGVLKREVAEDGRVLREIDSGGRVTRMLYDAQGAILGQLDPYQRVLPPAEVLPQPEPLGRTPLPETPLGLLLGSDRDVPPQIARGGQPPLLSRVPGELKSLLSTLLQLYPVGRSAEPVRTYDGLGRVVSEVDSEGRNHRWVHDRAGNEVGYRDPDGRIWQQRIGRWNLVTAVEDPLGAVTRYGYSSTEQVVRVVDPAGTQSDYEYDEKDRLVKIARNGRLHEQYTWDTGDRLLQKQDALGRVLLRMEYEDGERVETRHLGSGGVHLLEHDEQGRVIRASTGDHEVELNHDLFGQIRGDLRDGRGIQRRWVGSRCVTTVLGRFAWSLEGTAGDPLRRLGDPTGGEHMVWWDERGMLLREHAQGLRELTQYDGEGRLLSHLSWRQDFQGVHPPRWTRYAYTPDGDLTTVWEEDGRQTRYTTDAAHRLTREEGPHGRFDYVLDPAGNLLGKPGLENTVLAEANRLAQANDETFAYDVRAHLSERKRPDGSRTRYTYDSADMLVRVEDGKGEPWTAGYDALGRRIRCGRGTWQREFFWDGDRLAAELSPQGRLRLYVYAGHDALVPVLFVDYPSVDAAPESGQIFVLIVNQAGAPFRVEDASGRTVWRASRIEPYGHITVAPDSQLELNLRLPGQYYDADTGLFYNRYRYYDPVLGRYLQSDPLDLEGGTHLYAYAPNPLVQFDALGLVHSKKGKANKVKTTAITKLGVFSYSKARNMVRKKKYKGIDCDHIPSSKACKKAIEDHLGNPLTKAEYRKLHNHITAMHESRNIHRSSSRTYGGRNNQKQIAKDAQDLEAASKKDMKALKESLKNDGWTDKQIKDAFDNIHQRNKDIGLYDDLDKLCKTLGFI